MKKAYQQPCATIVALVSSQSLAGSVPKGSDMDDPEFNPGANRSRSTWEDDDYEDDEDAYE